MGAFKELDPNVVRKALEGQQDLLTSESKKEEAFFRNTSCPACGSKGLEQVINARYPFSPGAVLPNKLLRCTQCKAEHDPYTRLITSAGLS